MPDTSTAPSRPSGPSSTRITAPCGCSIDGRVVTQRACTVMDHDTATGAQMSRHLEPIRREAKRRAAAQEA